ncbi:MAG: hypothetical protein E6J00_15010 [Chloroflexi bacterium]|nr:MAG: hypothetical protein E6J00_15010 [Chloroflexota bacterium]
MPDEFEKLIETGLRAELGPLLASITPPAAGTFLWLGRRPRWHGLATTRTLVLGFAAAVALAAGMIAATEAAVSQCQVVFDPGERGVGHCADSGIATATQPKPQAVPGTVRQVQAAPQTQAQAPTAGSSGGIVQAPAPATSENAGSGSGTDTRTGGGIGPQPSPTPPRK